MRKIIYLLTLICAGLTAQAQKLTGEFGMGFGTNFLTSGDGSDYGGGMAFALNLSMRYHFDDQLSLGFHFLGQDPITSPVEERILDQVILFPETTNARILSLNGRYAFHKKGKNTYFFVGMGLGWNQQKRFVHINDVASVSNSGLSLLPELGFQWKGLSHVLSITTPVATPTFDQINNEDGLRYVMERGRVSTFTYSVRYSFRLLSKKID